MCVALEGRMTCRDHFSVVRRSHFLFWPACAGDTHPPWIILCICIVSRINSVHVSSSLMGLYKNGLTAVSVRN